MAVAFTGCAFTDGAFTGRVFAGWLFALDAPLGAVVRADVTGGLDDGVALPGAFAAGGFAGCSFAAARFEGFVVDDFADAPA